MEKLQKYIFISALLPYTNMNVIIKKNTKKIFNRSQIFKPNFHVHLLLFFKYILLRLFIRFILFLNEKILVVC